MATLDIGAVQSDGALDIGAVQGLVVPAALEVNVSDSIVITEAITPLLPLLEVSVSDSVVVAESITPYLETGILEVSVSDSIVVAESTTPALIVATRFYLPSTGSAPITPAYDANWDDTASAARLPCYTTKQDTSVSWVGVAGDTDVTDKDYLIRQWSSEAIAAQTISAGTFDIAIQTYESDTGNNLFSALSIRVVSNDGTVVRGTILSLSRDNTEVALAGPVCRYHSGTTTEVVASAGDRIVIEIGIGGDPAADKGHNGSIGIIDDHATDLPENDTEITAYSPWVELQLLEVISFVSDLEVDVNDSAVVAESVTAQLPLYEVSVSDDVVVAESTTAQLPLYEVSLSDSVVVAESITPVVASGEVLTVSVVDSIVVSESITAQLPLYEVNVSDSTVVSESVTAQLPLYEVSEYESVVVSESVIADKGIREVSVSESIIVSENITALLPLYEVSVSDSIVTAESITALAFSAICVSPIISSQGTIHDGIFSGVIARGHNK